MAYAVETKPGSVSSLGQQIYTTSALFSLTSIPTGSRWCLIIPEQAVRWRDDKTAPTVSAGMPISAGQVLEYSDPSNFSNIQIISQSGSATVNVAWFGGT